MQVLIIGAGAAGLYAGYLLHSKGIKFQILEASNKYGGRVAKLTGFADYPLDLGGEWLHGKNSISGELVAKSHTKVSLDDSDEVYWFDGEIVEDLPEDVFALFEEDEDVPDVSFKEYAIDNGFGKSYAYLVEAIAADFGASAANISAYWTIKEGENWDSGDDDFKFKDTYFDLLDKQLAAHIQDHIQLNTVVKSINYSDHRVVVTDTNGETYTADKVIITLPISILKSNSIRFTPSLPHEKTQAFAKIGMEAGMKVFLKFSDQFYDQGILGGKISSSYLDEIEGKQGKDNVLLAFVMGKQAEYLTSLGSDKAIVEALLEELDEMYDGEASETFLKAYIQNWTEHPHIQGAYSYATVGMGNARQVAARSVDKKLFFAGEAMNLHGNHASVHGAMQTGLDAVNQLLKTL